MAKSKTLKAGDIKEGDFFYVAGRGILMAHYPMRDKSSKYHQKPKSQDKLHWEGEGSPPPMDRNSILFVSVDPDMGAYKIEPEHFDGLNPVPSLEDFQEAIKIGCQIEPDTQLTNALMARLVNSGDVKDNARLMRISKSYRNNATIQKYASNAVGILRSVNFYHEFLVENPSKKRMLTAKTAAKKYRSIYEASSKAFLASSHEIADALKAKGDYVITVEPEIDPAEKRRAEKSAKAAERRAAREASQPAKAQEKADVTDEQRVLVAEAVEDTKGFDDRAQNYVAAKRLSELFEVGKVGFKDTVILLCHVFKKPSGTAGDTLKILREGQPDTDITDKTQLQSSLKGLRKRMLRQFGNASTPEDQSVKTQLLDWRAEL